MAKDLQRSLSLVDATGLGINCVIGSGIFLLVGKAAGLFGAWSILSTIAAAVLSILIALCFAEVSTHFGRTGGPYLYARKAFGSFVGFEVGWMVCCVGIISWAAMANALVTATSHFIPEAQTGVGRITLLLAVMGGLTWINLSGAKSGAKASNVFTAAKLLPLIVFVLIAAGTFEWKAVAAVEPVKAGTFGETTLLMLYAFVGFEGLVVPAGEMRNPKRSLPLAMILVMSIVAVIYIAVQLATMGTLSTVSGHANPVVAASNNVMGPIGGSLIGIGIIVSILGVNTAAALITPRRIYAMAEQGQLPKVLASIDDKHGVPTNAVWIAFLLAFPLAVTGSFQQLAVISVVARFVQYIPTCVAVFSLRRQSSEQGGFRVPFGPVIPALAIGLCVWLLMETQASHLLAGTVALAAGVPFYWLTRKRQPRPKAMALESTATANA